MHEFFYSKLLKKHIKNKESSLLVVAGGLNDFDVLKNNGYKNVTISNCDERMKESFFSPFSWSYQNAESLTYPDNKFDFVIVHEGLHHCYSPHKALLEMYRVSKVGILCIESKESKLMQLIYKLKLTYKYELSAVFKNNMLFGGVGNSEIPNFIYRWNEREIKKTINSFAPYCNHKIIFNYDYGTPYFLRDKIFLKQTIRILVKILRPILLKEFNLFGFYVEKHNKNSNYFPWLTFEKKKIKLKKDWLKNNWEKTF